ncbi:MAG TPA: hypothetical protein ENJ60_11625 [Aeromonadales bacterium]|nr:hypothetical protein [Aeromonadales bacterium]
MITVPIIQQPVPVPAQSQLPVESIRVDNQQVPPVPQPAQLFQAKANRTVSTDKANSNLAEANSAQNAGSTTGSANAAIGDSAQTGDGEQSSAEDSGLKQNDSKATGSDKAAEAQQQQLLQQQISELASRDREVRAHESAHAAVGGQFTGAPQFSFQKGPDGVLYAIGGEVSISTSEVPGDPEATLAKLETVIRAALAPAEPSGQDIRVASSAAASAAQIRSELALSKRKDLSSTTSDDSTSSSSEPEAKVSIKSISQILERRIKNTGALLSSSGRVNPFSINI